MNEGQILFVCTSHQKGMQKQPVQQTMLIRGHGLEGDAHAGNWHRQVSLLEEEQVDLMRQKGLDLAPGAFGENIVTKGFDLEALDVGSRFRVGDVAVLQMTQRGKECHDRCIIYHQAGDCIMPRHGVFARVRRGGPILPGVPLTTDPELDRVRYAVLTLSDRGAAGSREDRSGKEVSRLLDSALDGIRVARTILPDDQQAIESELVRLCDEEVCDLVVTTGGTGLSPRDVTPEATLAVIEREIPGMAEAVRAASLVHTARAMLSRGVSGLRGQTIIINLSGSPKAVQEQLQVLLPALPHAVETASGVPLSCAR
jgi:molybdenum cofactor synthesis domain-containing protein